MILYHYKPLKNLENITNLKNYLNQKIWFTRLDKFNDPFEGTLYYKPATPKDVLMSPELFENYYMALNKLSPSLTRDDFRGQLEKEEDEAIGDSFLTNYNQTHGALCLTPSNSNIPMWAHYADNHQGYCVIFKLDFDEIYNICGSNFSSREEFDGYISCVVQPSSAEKQEILSFTQALDIDKKIVFTKVIYSDEPSAIDEVDIQALLANIKNDHYGYIKYIIKNSVSVKFLQWNYENEYRLIVNTNSIASGLLDLRGYPFLKVTGVILGENLGKNLDKDAVDFIRGLEFNGKIFKTTEQHQKVKEFIAELCQQHGIDTYQAFPSKKSYKIEIEDYKLP